jgi:hypothetical protein
MKGQIKSGMNKNYLNDSLASTMLAGKTLLLALIMSSCAHSYYIPKGPNVPLFTEKNEFHGSISVGAGEISSSTDVQAAYAISDHFGAMTDFMSSSGNMYDDKNSAKTRYFDGALGYFKPFDKFMVFEVFGGIGTGNQKHEYYSTSWNSGQTTSDGKADIHFTKFFLQPSLGATFNAFDIALSTSLIRLNYNIKMNTVINSSPHNEELKYIAENNNPLLLEPAFTIRGGWKYVKVQLQYVYSLNLTTPEMYMEKSKFSIGVYFSVANKYKKNGQVK